jgi:aminopeptidase
MSEPFDQLLEKYARLVVQVGVGVRPGQEVVINGLPEQAEAARAIADEAYRAGASRVEIVYGDPHLQKSQVLHAPVEMLGKSPDYRLQQAQAWGETKPALISLTGNPFPTLMEGLDPERLARSQPMDLMEVVIPIVTGGTVAWTVVGAPTKGWADSIGISDVLALWDAVATAMRLDEADPVAAWRTHLAKLKRRAEILNGHAFDRVRYQGPGTDVTLGLAPESLWVGGSLETDEGVEFVPNMPTEEVFFAPDWRRAEGSITTTAPFFLMSMGTMVEGLELDVHDGSITGVRASRGEAEVQKQFELIPRSRHFGEVAIVDRDSAVARTGLVFKDMLYDENIGSHIAWGMGYPTSFRGALEQSEEDRIASGLNQAATHVDVVIGSPEVQIDGIHADGSVVPVTRGNAFVLTD